MSVEHIGKGYVKICVSEEELENSIAGLSQLKPKVFPLDDSGNYAELASYLIKYTGTHKKGTDGALQGKRWNCSKNLVRPEPEYHIISDREYFKKEPKAIKGYYVDKNSVSMGVHSPEYYGYGYLRYTLVKITDRGG